MILLKVNFIVCCNLIYEYSDFVNKTKGETEDDMVIRNYKKKVKNVAKALLNNMEGYMQLISKDIYGSTNNIKILCNVIDLLYIFITIYPASMKGHVFSDSHKKESNLISLMIGQARKHNQNVDLCTSILNFLSRVFLL